MELRVRQVAPDEPQRVIALEQRLNRALGGEAVWTAEIAVFDQRHSRPVGPEHMVALPDRRQLTGDRRPPPPLPATSCRCGRWREAQPPHPSRAEPPRHSPLPGTS